VKEMTEQIVRMKPNEDGNIEPPCTECPQCGCTVYAANGYIVDDILIQRGHLEMVYGMDCDKCKHHICVRIEVGTDWDFSTKSVIVEIEEYD
tara:strand:- start:1706 stop:1981 length:276 start_codon:yes stop_codon:yes gene_type:complete